MIKQFTYIKYIILFCVFLLLLLFTYFQNNNIVTSTHIIKSDKLPKEFNNFKILHISDFHNKLFLKNNINLIKKIKLQKPDIIVITGDLIDRRKYNEKNALLFIDKIKNIAPIYYVTGNHEGWCNKFSSLEKKLKNRGVLILRNKCNYYKKGNSQIAILGIDDPSFTTDNYSKDNRNYNIIEKELNTINNHYTYDKNIFKILLCHRPEIFDLYVKKNINLVFTGHAHGGQIILPFIGGLIAPNQGFFPKYYKGTYKKNNTVMVVSRGLGNSLAPLRIFNRPEIVVIKLRTVHPS